MRRVALLAIALAAQLAALPVLAQPRPSGAQPAKDLVDRGRELYEAQQYEESIQTLSGALVRSTNTVAQKLEIDRLLALDHITLGHKEEAENFVRALLALQPDYELPRSESPRFRDFFAAARARWEADGRPGLAAPATATAPVTMKHSSPAQAAPGDEVTLTASLGDPDHRAKSVALFYRTGSGGAFVQAAAQLSADGAVRATLPPRAVQPPFVAYYLLASDAAGVPLAARGDADAPLRIAVADRSGGGWVLPVAIGGGVVGAAGIVLGSLALAGVFKGNGGGGGAKGQSTVSIGVMSFR
jgi:tetratricopeptide (TPR) repeat protein